MVHGRDRSEVPLLDEVGQGHADAGVALRHRHDQSQVGADERRTRPVTRLGDAAEFGTLVLAVRIPVAEHANRRSPGFDRLGEAQILGGCEQRVAAHVIEVGGDGIVVRLCAPIVT
ncbi:MAG TPA: hypothetical protein VMU14_22040 [Acidimicrobiales bacterium]|nr:hypothetical protein [Acidimicrobiales bacterium]